MALSVREILDLELDARGRAAVVGHGTGTGKAYLGYADALAEYATHKRTHNQTVIHSKSTTTCAQTLEKPWHTN